MQQKANNNQPVRGEHRPVGKHLRSKILKSNSSLGAGCVCWGVRLRQAVGDVVAEVARVSKSVDEILRALQHGMVGHEVRRTDASFVIEQTDGRTVRRVAAAIKNQSIFWTAKRIATNFFFDD